MFIETRQFSYHKILQNLFLIKKNAPHNIKRGVPVDIVV